MFTVALLAIPLALWVGFVYLGREQLGAVGLGLATLRTIGVTALLLLLFNPESAGRVVGGAPVVLLDGSLSMGVPGGKWARALDTALALAGDEGTVTRFGAGVAPFDTLSPSAATTRLKQGLYTSRASGGPIHIVTDGEIEDIASITPEALRAVAFVVVPRDTVPDAALLDVYVRDRVQQADSLDVVVTIGTWGSGLAESANIELAANGRVLIVRPVELPPSPGVGRRRVRLPPRLLPPGVHVVHFRLVTAGDSIPGDDRRMRVITVTEQPGIVVVADPIDWEGRFLASELGAVALTTVRAFARLSDSSWIDMNSLGSVTVEAVRNATRQASMVVVRGGNALATDMVAANRVVWRWPSGRDPTFGFLRGDWYLNGEMPSSPLTGKLGLIDWESLPPLNGVVPLGPDSYDWIALLGRLARRGAERPVLIGREVDGVRQLVTTGSGVWRWGFRGGAAREAYRTLLASGTDWLLESGARRVRDTLTASPVVSYGESITFRWGVDPIPDTLTVVFRASESGVADTAALWFDAEGIATHKLPPGAYEWSVTNGNASGMVAVEEYSEELHPRTVYVADGDNVVGTTLVERYARENLWLFVIVILALAGEWGWRYRKGLP